MEVHFIPFHGAQEVGPVVRLQEDFLSMRQPYYETPADTVIPHPLNVLLIGRRLPVAMCRHAQKL